MIRVKNTRTGRTTEAHNGKDAALLVKVEQDRRSSLEAQSLTLAASGVKAGQPSRAH